jgi:arylsulfatase A
MKRLKLLTFIFLSLVSSLLATEKKKPNIILIMTDDVGMEWFGSYGNIEGLTPNLDQLSAKGTFFKHCYSQPICTPSRVKIMTGRYAFRNYKGFEHLPQGEITFGHLLKEAGYKTAVVGKWQLASYPSKHKSGGLGMTPTEAGFDEHCNWSLSQKGSRYMNPTIETNGNIATYPDGYGPNVMCDYVIDFIDKNKTNPFFIYYPMVLPHSPHVPTPDSKKPENKDHLQNFRDMIAYTDKIMGRLMSKLKALDLYEDTLLMFTSDNGTAQAIRAQMIGGVEYKGAKGSMTNPGTHVPLIASWPGVVKENQVIHDLVDFSDFLPTLVEVAGAELPKDRIIDGVSFFPQLKGEEGQPREWAYCNYWNQGRTKAGERQWIRNQRFKLYSNGDFFDIENDTFEHHPIPMGEGMELVETQRRKLQSALDDIGHKIDHSFDYSKTKAKKDAKIYIASLEALSKTYRNDIETKDLISSIESLTQQRLDLAHAELGATTLDPKELQNRFDKKKFKNKKIKKISQVISKKTRELANILATKDSEFSTIFEIIKKHETAGKSGLGKD